MPPLTTPATPARQELARRTFAALDVHECAPERLLAWNEHPTHDPDGRSVIYWMARAQRGEHNLALDSAIAAARALDLPLVVVFRLVAGPTGTEARHVDHVLRGLGDAFDSCRARGAHVVMVHRGGPTVDTVAARDALHAALVITDEDVMPRARRGRAAVAARLGVPLVSVDADVIVPGAVLGKREYAARTIRPRIHRVLATFDRELGHDHSGPRPPDRGLPASASSLRDVTVFGPASDAATDIDPTRHLADAIAAGTPQLAGPVTGIGFGAVAARSRVREFVDRELAGYATRRNKPELDATSRLSHSLHLGHLSVHEAVGQARASDAPAEDVAAFVEELVVRRELAWNFVRWNPDASSLAGAPDWARKTLALHASDPREWSYSWDQLEHGDTHDPLWNASQRQLVARGHMHGYVRMYWAKKLLEWHADPAEAFDVALRLNDRWQLDGRDPNGIVGVAWAIAGVHDRPWTERPIFGQVRYMSLASTGRKFDSRAYVARWGGLRGAALIDPGWYASATPSLLD
ncbi:MAG: phrA [Thermoleophilia bacterium]|nr:phrA [Thermoleophilia bacterium]